MQRMVWHGKPGVLAIYGTWIAAAEVVRPDGPKLVPIKAFDSGEDCAQQRPWFHSASRSIYTHDLVNCHTPSRL